MIVAVKVVALSVCIKATTVTQRPASVPDTESRWRSSSRTQRSEPEFVCMRA